MKDHIHHERTKYIDIQHHLVRDVVSDDKIIVKKIGTVSNPANMLSLPITKFKFCKNSVAICNASLLLLLFLVQALCYFD
jgi:hypothetical protein